MDTIDLLKQEKGFLISCVNACSLYPKLDNVSSLVINCDITIIIESWLNTSHSDQMVNIPGYGLIRMDRKPIIDKRGGGIVVYIREDIDYTMDAVNCHVFPQYEILTVDYKIHQTKYKLIACYKPPSVNAQPLYDILTTIKQADHYKRKIIIAGDFNTNYDDAIFKRTYVDPFCVTNDLTQHITVPTRITQNSSTIIDHIYSNLPNILKCGTIDFYISDHLPTYLLIKSIRNKIPKKQVWARIYKNYNKADFLYRYTNADWSEFNFEASPNQLWDIMLSNIEEALSHSAPIRKIIIPNHTPIWLTPAILEQMRQRDYLFRRAKNSKLPDDWNISRNQRNRVQSMIYANKKNIISNLLNRVNGSPDKFWTGIRHVLPNTKDHNIVKLNHQVTSEPINQLDCADYINKYFATIGQKLADDLDIIIPPIDKSDSIEDNPNDITFELFSMEDVIKVIKTINVKKSSSIKNIKSAIFKDVFLHDSGKLAIIFNATLIRQEFPDKWKSATITPIPKKGDSHSVNNLRPISLLPLPGKLLERLICNRLQSYLDTNNILTSSQHGFRPAHSTISAISQYLVQIYNNLNSGVDTVSLYLDLRKAFDTISHNILLNKLKTIGLNLRTRDWFQNYLTNRTQRVYANGVLSSSLPITHGVPQGSVLGPVLFSLYINSLPDAITPVKVVMYADDAVILTNSGLAMQSLLPSLHNWCKENSLTVNDNKTMWMSFICKPNTYVPRQLTLNNKILQHCDEFNYLGLIIDEKLTFKSQHKKVLQQLTFRALQLAKIRRYINTKTAVIIYKTMSLPYLDYADFIWNYGTQFSINQLQLVQNKSLRTTYKVKLGRNPIYTTGELHELSRCKTVIQRRDLHAIFAAFDLKSDPSLIDDRNLSTRRHDGIRLIQKSIKHLVYSKSFLHRGIYLWNNLKNYLTQFEDKLLFKLEIKKTFPQCFLTPNYLHT